MAARAQLNRTYRYRIYPTVRLQLDLEAQLGFACQLYNAALEQRRYAWRGRHLSVSLFEQFRELTAVRGPRIWPAKKRWSTAHEPTDLRGQAPCSFFRPDQNG